MTLGERITALRTARGLSQQDLADQLGLSRQSISKWELDAATPELPKLLKLSEFFHITLDELVKGPPSVVPAALAASANNNNSVSASATAPPVREGNTRKIVGVILICFSVMFAFLLMFQGGWLSAVFSTPFLACGILCLTVKRRLGLWCTWTVWLCVELYLRWGTGITWQMIFQTAGFEPSQNYVRLVFGWIMAIVPVILIFCTIRSFRAVPCPFQGKPAALLLGWAGLAGLRMLRAGAIQWLFAQWYASGSEPHILSDRQQILWFWIQTLGDVFTAAALCGIGIWTCAFLRDRLKNAQDTQSIQDI